jgi:uncharacterized protein
VKHVILKSEKIKKPLVIGIVSDLQTDHVSDYERHVLSSVLEERPDLILLPGDYVQQNPPQRWAEMKALHDLLADLKFSAPNGTFAVQGNAEDPSWPNIFAKLPVKSFVATGSVRARDDVQVHGLSFEDSFNPKLNLNATSKDKFSIVFGHGPDFALGNVNGDLLVAGHTHGGQVQLPSLGPLMTLSRVSTKWGAGGLFDVREGTKLLITRGAGMERSNAPRLRFLCRPEIVIAHIEPLSSTAQNTELLTTLEYQWVRLMQQLTAEDDKSRTAISKLNSAGKTQPHLSLITSHIWDMP